MNITLQLTDREASYLLLLVRENDKKLRSDRAYKAFSILHDVKRKLQAVENMLAEKEEAARDRDEW